MLSHDDIKKSVRETLADATPLFRRCFDFVEDQSEGEWGDELVLRDAIKLNAFVEAEIKGVLARTPPGKLSAPEELAAENRERAANTEAADALDAIKRVLDEDAMGEIA